MAISQYPVESWESPGENATAFPRLHPKGASSRSGRHVGRWPPRNDKSENLAPLNLCHDHCRSAWRSLSAATDAIGRCVFIDTLHELEVPSRDCTPRALPRASRSGRHVGRWPPRNGKAGGFPHSSLFIFQSSGFIHFRAPPLQRTPRQGAKKAPIFRSELHVGVTYLPVQSPAKYCRRK